MVLGKQGRVDDNIETIRKRFKVFVESSIPVVDYYQTSGKVNKVLELFSSQPTMFSNAILVCAVGWRINDASDPDPIFLRLHMTVQTLPT